MEDKKQYIELADIGQTKKALLSIVDHEPLILYHDDLHPEVRVLVCSDNHAKELERTGVIFDRTPVSDDTIGLHRVQVVQEDFNKYYAES